jgi:hypothetical protein
MKIGRVGGTVNPKRSISPSWVCDAENNNHIVGSAGEFAVLNEEP